MKKRNVLLITLVFTSILFWSCTEEKSSEPENEIPSCVITAPDSNAIFHIGDSIIVYVTADDDDGNIIDVSFFRDDYYLGKDSNSPFSYAFVADSLKKGVSIIKAVAQDNEGSEKVAEIPIQLENILAPSNLTTAVISETSIKLEWMDNSNRESGFRIDRKVGISGTWVTSYASVDTNIKTYTDTSLTTGVTYYYKVRAFYLSYYSSYTSEVSSEMVPLNFVSIPTGTFNMGGTDYFDEQPIHTVRITRAFYLGKYEVTQQEWLTTMGNNPSYFTGDLNRPVEQVSLYSILVYCNNRSITEGLSPCYSLSNSTDPAVWGSVPTSPNSTWDAAICNWSANGYRLPTEAEWEYAARYNDGRKYPWGEAAPTSTLCNHYPFVGATTAVGSYPSGNSSLGLCDMAGNVWEWVWDWFADYPSTEQTDPTGPSTAQTERTFRGGAYTLDNDDVRCAFRSHYQSSDYDFVSVGFRLARTK